MIKKIGILTSGGDAPGMNNALVGAIRTGCRLNKEMYVVYEGYKGLIDGNIHQVGLDFAKDKISYGGTVLKSARLKEFKEESVRQKAVENLKKEGIDALIVIGGDGSFIGAKKLTEMGINCIGLPGTIDNDIASSDITIGFDTALNTITNAIDNIVDTTSSHHRCIIVEVMGNNCPDLSTYAGIACNAHFIINKDHNIEKANLITDLKKLKEQKEDYVLIVLSEKLLNADELAKEIIEKTGWDTRVSVLGYIQRGGRPTAMERFNALRMGSYAVKLLDQGIGGVCVGIKNNELYSVDIYEGLKIERNKHLELYDVHDLIK
ncbi:MAG TPA: 6-phosphofructokinase [Candidatus Onthovivens sp.]|nr:6-phosphofructokinase [Candidatus Onthovivens sp.]